MPTLTPPDIQQIESAAKYIFDSSRATVDLSSVDNAKKFSNIFALCESFPEYKNGVYSEADKIYMMFYSYVAPDDTAGAKFKRELNACKKLDLLSLKEKALSIEGALHKMIEMPSDIVEYVKNLMLIEHISKLIVTRHTLELKAIYKVEDFNERVYQFERMILLLNCDMTNALASFGNVNTSNSAYLSTCSSLIEMVNKVIYKEIIRQIEDLNRRVSQIIKVTQINNVVKRSELEAIKEELIPHLSNADLSSDIKYIYETMCFYIDACKLIYLPHCDGLKELPENTLHIYRLLNTLMSATNDVISILEIPAKCKYMADKLFNPLATKKQKPDDEELKRGCEPERYDDRAVTAINGHLTESNTEGNRVSNVDRCRVALANNEPRELIIRMFRFPSHTATLNAKCLWDSVERNTIADIKCYIDIINFFQDYISPERLLFVLKAKYKAQVQYVSLLSNDEFNRYYNLMANDLVGKNYRSELYPYKSIIQEYDAKLIEHLAHEEYSRKGRLCHKF